LKEQAYNLFRSIQIQKACMYMYVYTHSADFIDFIDKSMLKAELLSLAPREINVASPPF